MFVTIKDSVFKVKVCNSPQEKVKGMMKQKFTDFDGMLFFMGEDYHCFHMKNCIISLDIIFIDSNLRVQKIFNDCLPCGTEDDCERYCSESKYVLEIEGGLCNTLGIKEGNHCTFTFDISK
jgi:uncharacterized membrane protein (UPF0127 family)